MVYIYHIFFIHSLANEYFLYLFLYLCYCEECYNKHVNVDVFDTLTSFPLNIHPVVELLDPMVVLLLSF
jgi:hypothetical protein